MRSHFREKHTPEFTPAPPHWRAVVDTLMYTLVLLEINSRKPLAFVALASFHHYGGKLLRTGVVRQVGPEGLKYEFGMCWRAEGLKDEVLRVRSSFLIYEEQPQPTINKEARRPEQDE